VEITAAFNLLLVVATVFAFAGAGLRTWAAAYLGDGVMSDTRMHGERVVADGPYRYVRNPMYVGTWLNTVALALLMPASGAVFAIVAMAVFELRLILREEALLGAEQGSVYADYCARVPRVVAALGARVPATGVRPRWARAVTAEIFLWGTAVSFAAVGWRYNAELLLQCVLVSFGVSLVVRALRMGPGEAKA
jgi:Phospholipid methyltransferase